MAVISRNTPNDFTFINNIEMTDEFAYTGKILKVDLSSGRTTSLPTSDYTEDYIGGRGMAARIYWDEVSPDIKPFDPENCMIFATGPLAGVRGLAGPRWVVAGKSCGGGPGQFCHCNLGGHWGVELKRSGYDGLVLKGRAEKPSYLFIREGAVEIRDASSLIGEGAIETREPLKNQFGDSVSVVACGPAGENRVPIANIIADADASGAGGFGAVMGSKKLKAIAVVGSCDVKVANQETLQQLIRHAAGLKKGLTPLDMGLDVADSKMKKRRCFGCPGGCVRADYKAGNGSEGKYMCQSALFYKELARLYYNDHVGAPTLESQVLSAVTGRETNEEGLNHVGERIFNLERAIHVREGHSGRQEDALPDYCFEKPAKPYVFYNPGCLVPGKNGEVISRKGAVLDREKFEDMKTEYYQLRGRDCDTGLQTRAKLNELGLTEIADELEKD